MSINRDNIFTSGWTFSDREMHLKSRWQMVNVALILSTFAFIFGIIINIINDILRLALIESALVLINIVLFYVLRKYKSSFETVTMIITAQCTFFMLYILYTSDLNSMKFIWLFTYPIVLLYFQKRNNGIYWFLFLLIMLIIAPLQNFMEIKLSLFQTMYISVVLVIVAVIVFFYQINMNEARDLILQQQDMLKNFNSELEKQVNDKTIELIELNESLEEKVQDKIDELIHKDKLLTAQSKQAVMGEMISMIAHQWRQPLSTITLQISNLQFKKLLGKEIISSELDDAFNNISDTIIYLSETIDDFKTYFHPDKEIAEVEVHELLHKAVNFTQSRVKYRDIEISIIKSKDINIKTYVNELIQVVLNILNNAFDAHDETELKDPIIKLSVKEAGSDILIYIADNAGGIKDENLPKLFEPYFSTKGKNGTGLGLYMSQMIIQKQFNGEIDVKTSGNFSTFIIKIPKHIS